MTVKIPCTLKLVEVIGIKTDSRYELRYLPANPTAKKIMENNPSVWSKITDSVDDFVTNPKNASKLANVAEAASQNYPNNKRDFETTGKAIKSCAK